MAKRSNGSTTLIFYWRYHVTPSLTETKIKELQSMLTFLSTPLQHAACGDGVQCASFSQSGCACLSVVSLSLVFHTSPQNILQSDQFMFLVGPSDTSAMTSSPVVTITRKECFSSAHRLHRFETQIRNPRRETSSLTFPFAAFTCRTKTTVKYSASATTLTATVTTMWWRCRSAGLSTERPEW